MPHSRIPQYRLHKSSGQAVVVLAGKSIYLGLFNSPESRIRYDRVLADWLTARRSSPAPSPAHHSPSSPSVPGPDANLSVNELVLAYWSHCKHYYRKQGQPSGELPPIKFALGFVRRLHGAIPARSFGPLALKAVRDAMVTHPRTRQVKVWNSTTGDHRLETKVYSVGLARRTINKQLGRIKRMFAWAVAEELLPPSVHEALQRVEGLRKDRSAAKESPRIGPVPDTMVAAILHFLTPPVRAMVQVQRLSGCRPQDVVQMRGEDLATNGTIWEFRPQSYKTEHRNPDANADRERVIYLGPRAQVVLQPFLAMARGGYLFRPGQENRASGVRSSHYRVAGYRQAIRRACQKAKIAVWVPLQLRHTAATEIRRRFGLEASQAVLGHAELGVTQVYAEVDRSAAQRVMGEVG